MTEEKEVVSTRLQYIDNIRILLITLVIMVHLSVTYGGVGTWYYKEGRPDVISFAVLTMHNAISQSFFMGFFFLISGYFTPGSCDRKGFWRFLKDRFLRLGIPLLCYDFVINPLLAYPLIKANVFKFDAPFHRFLTRYYSQFHIGSLWFLETLLIFAVLYVLWRIWVKPAAPAVQSNTKMPGNMVVAMLAIALGIVSFVVRIWFPIGWTFAPLNLQFCFFPQYICLFIVGIAVYRRNWLLHIPDAMGKFWLCVAIVFIVILLPALFISGGALTGDVSSYTGGFHWQSFAYSVWEQFAGASIIVGLLVLFRKRFNKQRRLRKAMSASVYTVYIIQSPVIVLLALAMKNIRLYPLLKFALAALIAVPLCFTLANIIRKLPLARRIL